MIKALSSDLKDIWSLRSQTTELLRKRGIDQWQYDDPTVDIFKRDIMNGDFYVVKDENMHVIAMASIIFGTDPTYDVIHGGFWQTDAPYVTIHRLAVSRSHLGEGLGSAMMRFAEQVALRNGTNALRVDTHPDNRYATRLFLELGYVRRGHILLPLNEGDPLRDVFDKSIGKDDDYAPLR